MKSEENDNATILMKNKAKVCLKQKSFSTYSAKEKRLNLNLDDKTGVMFLLTFTERIKIINEEVLIISGIDLLGSLGGALGMFVGFSFFGYIADLLDAIVDKCSVCSFKKLQKKAAKLLN